jgi:hypothetical protein
MVLMKMKLFVLAGLAVAVIAIVIVSLRSPGKDTTLSTCEAFIAAIQKGDADTTYDMFTERGKSFNSKEKWSEQVAILQSVYGTQAAKPLGDAAVITNNETGEPESEQRPYAIQNGENKYKATCYITAAEPEKVDSFGSQVGY